MCVSIMDERKIVNGFIRGFRRIMILSLLCQKPRHGYNLIKEFKRITGKNLKPSVVYPFLYVLEDKGYLVGTWTKTNKHRIRNYEVTQKGKSLFLSIKIRLNLIIGRMLLDILFTDGKNR